MRILTLTDYFHPHRGGGVETLARETARGLAREHEVLVLTANTRGAAPAERMENVVVQRSPAIDLTALLRVQLCLAPRMPVDAIRLARTWSPDVIHLHTPWFPSAGLAAVAAARDSGRPLVTSLQLGEMTAVGGAVGSLVGWYERTIGRAIVRRSHLVLAPSPRLANYARHLGADLDRITLIPNGIDHSSIVPRRRPPGVLGEPPVVLFAARMVFNKGCHDVLAAYERALQVVPQAELWLVGEGPELARLRQRVAARSLHQVRFFPYREDLPYLLAEADLFVRPSLTEGVPLTVLDALASGVPVVASYVAGTPDVIVDGETGLLVPPGDVPALADAIVRLLTDLDLHARVAAAQRSRAVAPEWAAVAAAMAEAFARSVGDAAAPPGIEDVA